MFRPSTLFRSAKLQPSLSYRHVMRRPLFETLRYSSTSSTTDFEALLSKPTWSVKSLLPSSEQTDPALAITPEQLRHLLNLSALPAPQTPEEEAQMLKTLSSQLHFVRAIQEVDTKDVTPLRAIRDETTAARKEIEISLDSVKEALDNEVVLGKHYKRIHRREGVVDTKDAEDWNVLGSAEKKMGKYFVVDSGKPHSSS
ncbi:uncharacterized protein K452DRAFT_37778 [Aplosporella prunicola CBS 121167]|uniref:Glutamyl-tRNA amidotransferase complex subunit Gta3 domain-containing protein n=1 Tax=Aplosporella prunicola CBS 121167 TaxID=1176127 RepID=A0A6A6BFM9_9PEZI|nr:uncharacterized protein K452DRAFT_37778 [Aplosporella prunicola CBS 121167]KAF2141301.1 hypothetical protein K452DRAFT_37778 [Aplosporella prunicola CBS 121167]